MIHFFHRLHLLVVVVVVVLWRSLNDTLLLFLGHLAFVLLQSPLQVLVLLLGPAEWHKGQRSHREKNMLEKKTDAGNAAGAMATVAMTTPRCCFVPGAQLDQEVMQPLKKRLAGAADDRWLSADFTFLCSSALWVTYSFSWASRSLTSASRLLTRTTSSSSSSCSRLFWASVFCQSATREEHRPSDSERTEEFLKPHETLHLKEKLQLRRLWT